MCQVLYVGINPEENCISLMDPTGSFFYCMSIGSPPRSRKFLLRMQHASPAYFSGIYSM